MAIKINGYVPYPEEVINATIVKLETDMVSCLLKAAKWNAAGDGSTKWLKKADLKSLQIHTLVTKCEEKVYEFVDESFINGGCSLGSGIGSWKIAGSANSLNCDLFVVSLTSQIPPPNGAFRYCTFKTSTFTETVGTMIPCNPIVVGGLDYELDFELN
tara:strand:+ start:669 stop:1142 length:474 start_codon:yes stop_codon:yes gene_type:complete